MADLLASLEIGITRTVGAASRLRSQITNIDTYMSTQRQQDSHNHHFSGGSTTTYPNPHSLTGQSHHANNAYSVKTELPNPNIDPALQNSIPTSSTGSIPNGADAFQSPYDYTNAASNTSAGSVNGVSRMGGQQVTDDGFQFQLPPELLEGWPWNFDFTQGFGGGF
jgi:hypothetical protein